MVEARSQNEKVPIDSEEHIEPDRQLRERKKTKERNRGEKERQW